MKVRTYFWRNDNVDVLDRFVLTNEFNQSSMLKYIWCPCVKSTEDGQIYAGVFEQDARFKVSWCPCSVEDFRPEFRAYLLLLGVS